MIVVGRGAFVDPGIRPNLFGRPYGTGQENIGGQMSKIFISYRRTDMAVAGRIYDRLVGRFGENAVYMDLKNIRVSDPWSVHITKALLGCEVGLL